MKTLVTGAGGFIGGHLIAKLLEQGYEQIRATDIKPLSEWWQVHESPYVENRDECDLRKAYIAWGLLRTSDVHLVQDVTLVFHLAANMGGIGHITDKYAQAEILYNNTMMNVTILNQSRRGGVDKFFFSSSVCVYPVHRMETADYKPLTDADVYPAYPNETYGWEKLHMEHLCRAYRESYGFETYVARFQNCYGPHGSWNDGKEKAPAALCRKIAEVKPKCADKAQKLPIGDPPDYRGCEIEIWGDGKQTRSFTYVDDICEGIIRLVMTDHHDPITLGSSEISSIDNLADAICKQAGIMPHFAYDKSKPQGVRGRVFDHTKLEEVLGWVPEITLEEGIAKTYPWIEEQVKEMMK